MRAGLKTRPRGNEGDHLVVEHVIAEVIEELPPATRTRVQTIEPPHWQRAMPLSAYLAPRSIALRAAARAW